MTVNAYFNKTLPAIMAYIVWRWDNEPWRKNNFRARKIKFL